MNRCSFEKKHALIMVEGDTEILFYRRSKEVFFNSKASKIINLKGNWNINKKILNRTEAFARDHKDTLFSIVICIDKESRFGLAPIDMQYIKEELSCYDNINKDEILLFEAVQDIESWFFHDIDGIYEFLRISKAKRKPEKYIPVEKLNNRDLSRLYKQADKDYRKGDASKHFVDSLNLKKIRSKAVTFDEFCNFMEGF
ncbi:MAG: DUF4276 family protein [Pseudomonadota bacterium]